LRARISPFSLRRCGASTQRQTPLKTGRGCYNRERLRQCQCYRKQRNIPPTRNSIKIIPENRGRAAKWSVGRAQASLVLSHTAEFCNLSCLSSFSLSLASFSLSYVDRTDIDLLDKRLLRVQLSPDQCDFRCVFVPFASLFRPRFGGGHRDKIEGGDSKSKSRLRSVALARTLAVVIKLSPTCCPLCSQASLLHLPPTLGDGHQILQVEVAASPSRTG